MEDEYCSDCKTYTTLVYDHCAGDTICTECGLVLESRSIDETAEWKLFANETYETHKLNRVGCRNNPLVSSGGLGTFIADPPTTGSLGEIITWSRTNSSRSSDDSGFVQWKKPIVCDSKEDSQLSKAFNAIEEMADSLGLVQIIKGRAKEIYKKANDHKVFVKYWKNHTATMVACLYLASQEEGLPRTFKEIHTVANGANAKDIHKVIQMLKKHLEVGRKTICAKDISRRYCCTLGLNNHAIKAVQEILQKIEEFDIRRNYTSILASVIYMVTQLSDNKINLSEIAKVSTVSEGALRNTYKDLCPLSSVLIPSWYANAEDIKKLYNI